MELALFLGFVALVVGLGVWFTKRDRAKWRALLADAQRPKPEPLPEYWVGITRYEGQDQAAAEAAYLVLRDEADRIPGSVELMHGAQRVRFFKVV
jgi:hypothetical protein